MGKKQKVQTKKKKQKGTLPVLKLNKFHRSYLWIDGFFFFKKKVSEYTRQMHA